ncbi:hypothetical protein X750_29390 [Mesorhizobium sp. LNJC394B00]|nr:hypothetical protein X750_29390 [Mesorhizobium sp. LNJC394B00]
MVWGKCRLPAAYIWVPPILTVTSTHQEYWDTITTTTAKMSARLRFARPLVPDSTWTLRKFYANGKLIYDATTGYRQSGLKFKAYDGRSTQLRDPTMVAEEGATNVSAHRGYLDIVVTDFDIVGLGAPPVFEAEWIQAASVAAKADFTVLLSTPIITVPVVDWLTGTFYAVDDDLYIRRFHISGLREIFAVKITFLSFTYAFIESGSLRYIPGLHCLFALAKRTGGYPALYAILIDAETGAVVAEDTAGTGAQFTAASALCTFGSASIFVGDSSGLGIHFIHRITQGKVIPTFNEVGWEGYSQVNCLTFGTVRTNDADLWICADDKLVKSIVTSMGALATTTEFASFSTDLVYLVWHDGDVIVFTDDAQAIRVDGATGATVWTKAVPYQITSSFAEPEMHRLDGVFFYQESTSYNFTDLDTGLTTSVSKTSVTVPKVVYDGQSNLAVATSQFIAKPYRTLFNTSDDGTERPLVDFLDESEIGFEGVIDDMVQGAVVDVTASVREIARSVCEPYSIAFFER